MDNREKSRRFMWNKRMRMQGQAIRGELPVKEWKICAHCGECYPFFSLVVQTARAKTCPEWFTGKDCYKKYRISRLSKLGGNPGGDRYYPKKKDCRATLCHVMPPCKRIDACLDKEIDRPGTIPLQADGSCKEPDSNYGRTPALQAIRYGL